ncbi:A/G-specific adenine glycosylase [Cardiobacteriaceae bacterium TAE3-ERU3]|nr:A/G-specific adenine glycosylase [Cardiobacteriaceae bacterium TAE3-ERU3]
MATTQPFAQRLIDWQRAHGRHHLPWQCSDPYRIWLSEIMLQQTQVSTVLNYYPRFIEHYPDVASLASAELDDVLALWSGLGYYSRARNLHHAAQQVVDEYNAQFPEERNELEKLKGVGRSTAAAIAVFAYGKREAILDGNVKRVLARHAGIHGVTSDSKTLELLWKTAEELLPKESDELRSYTQGLMDLGSLICTRSKPDCTACPVQDDCYAAQHNCTDILPTKKKRKILPEKSTVLLLLTSERGIHLYRRPDHGIWRNLWSLPEFSDSAAANAFAKKHGAIEQQYTGATFTHRFTHYALHITPIHITIHNPDPTISWFPNQEALSKGLPKPIRSIIERHLSEQTQTEFNFESA